ncbi:PREDICTED: molybdenum cofactor synthesis protein cinnamon [Rhagoletis zephyria]|uniref:molybdenum cofactor synthesis protein cinnamon n=1 Tax=Rhagoletis zephyria TaxID=28612 RepID=UPI0008117B8E|nr:PREDICTED: molybdenum cofactor synthesis protein cinnamon [Rhagoletis zephyria]
MADAIVFAVLTISDTCSQDSSKDRSGPRLVSLIRDAFQNANILTDIIADEREQIIAKLRELVAQKTPSVGAIITTGGTGFAPRDVTPEATKVVLDKECPQLSQYIAQASLQKTKFAALSRGVCGIANSTLILNFPGSEKAVTECFEVVRELLPHALQLIGNELPLVRRVHAELQAAGDGGASTRHVCPHKTGKGDDNDRNSPYPMISVMQALEIILETVQQRRDIAQLLNEFVAPVDIPPFRASIKDGYAMKSTGFSGTKKVLGYISAGDEEIVHDFQEDECYKINTGAPLPHYADCVVQVEDTKLLKKKKTGEEDLVEILVEPKANLDIRPIGSDLRKGSKLFPSADHSAVVIKSILASVGKNLGAVRKPKIGIISTGSELLAPQQPEVMGKIYDSNTTMLEELLVYFGFECAQKLVLSDDFEIVKSKISDLFKHVDFVICSGGVSMGDKDYIKPALESLGFSINFGRVNMKPGKPMTFASMQERYFFGLPGNPVSAFVTFHLFVLPAIRWFAGWERDKCELTSLPITLQNDSISLDPRPEYVRASVTSKNGRLYASVNGSQMSSRLQSIVGADVLVHLPGRTVGKPSAVAGDIYRSSVLRYDFISKYE